MNETEARIAELERDLAAARARRAEGLAATAELGLRAVRCTERAEAAEDRAKVLAAGLEEAIGWLGSGERTVDFMRIRRLRALLTAAGPAAAAEKLTTAVGAKLRSAEVLAEAVEADLREAASAGIGVARALLDRVDALVEAEGRRLETSK